ncbi:MAG: polyprenol monophosphomannose synthase [Acidimicrobiia bacterium]
MRSDVLVVVPTFNEAENLADLTSAVLALDVRLLIVDNNSPDGTGELAADLADGEQMAVLHREEKGGLGPAYAAGFAWGLEHHAQILCEMDADFSHDPTDLPRLIEAVDAGADVVIGSRYVQGGGVADWPVGRRALSRGGNLYASLLLGTRLKDMTGGYRAIRADAVRRLDPASCRASGYAFQIEMAWKAATMGMRVTEVPIVFKDRKRGTSKMTTSIAFEAIRLVTRWGWARRRGRLPWPVDEL